MVKPCASPRAPRPRFVLACPPVRPAALFLAKVQGAVRDLIVSGERERIRIKWEATP